MDGIVLTSRLALPLPTGLLRSPLGRGSPADGPFFFFTGLSSEINLSAKCPVQSMSSAVALTNA
jgi:hypothetical protein